jgi:hypothetical protein
MYSSDACGPGWRRRLQLAQPRRLRARAALVPLGLVAVEVRPLGELVEVLVRLLDRLRSGVRVGGVHGDLLVVDAAMVARVPDARTKKGGLSTALLTPVPAPR